MVKMVRLNIFQVLDIEGLQDMDLIYYFFLYI